MNGKVYLVGAGPGDPELLTLKGRRLLAEAEVVIYDFLANAALLRHIPESAEKIYVGKKGGDHTLTQSGINALIVAKAREGKKVVRLKGGDPFIFGRGGEEAEELVQAGVPFEVVPGVTSAVAVPAYAGIPLTHRRYNSSVALITGHEDEQKGPTGLDWSKLATGIETLVFLMGFKNLPRIIARLIENGRRPETPAALIRWGTTPRQQTVSGTLADIMGQAQAAGLGPPSIFVVGPVVALREQLSWFEGLPLFGRTVVVTRTRDQASDLIQQLTSLGAECLEFPTIRLVPPSCWDELDRAIAEIGSFHWIIFTSPNGVRSFFSRLAKRQKDARALQRTRLAAIGPATAAALQEWHLLPDLVPEKFQAEFILEALAAKELTGRKVLIPRAETAREVLPEGLRNLGAQVSVVTAYRTIPEEAEKPLLLERLQAGAVDCLTFTSSSTVLNFLALFDRSEILPLLRPVTVACIGPVTAQTARANGLDVQVIPESYTIPGLVKALVDFYHNQGSS
ncbi:MAG: uroporphyrinogen-III C-methyltransferase [Desulfobacterota bacterium]|jgi:uroporphyrinogen III methyltransferase/synthase|nr:uroporphyrinogen-III C-methyltransferase [Thermodesulfobacteriota bacterium]